MNSKSNKTLWCLWTPSTAPTKWSGNLVSRQPVVFQWRLPLAMIKNECRPWRLARLSSSEARKSHMAGPPQTKGLARLYTPQPSPTPPPYLPNLIRRGCIQLCGTAPATITLSDCIASITTRDGRGMVQRSLKVPMCFYLPCACLIFA